MPFALCLAVFLVFLQTDQTNATCENVDLSENLLDMLCKVRKPGTNGCSGLSRKHRPAFTASLARSYNLGSNEVIKFDTVWLNTGGVYNPKTGIFTAPKDGLYFVSSSVMANREKHLTQLHCHLWKNNQQQVGNYGVGYSQGALNAVMDLKTADRIYVKHDNGATEGIYGANRSMFSAYLITE